MRNVYSIRHFIIRWLLLQYLVMWMESIVGQMVRRIRVTSLITPPSLSGTLIVQPSPWWRLFNQRCNVILRRQCYIFSSSKVSSLFGTWWVMKQTVWWVILVFLYLLTLLWRDLMWIRRRSLKLLKPLQWEMNEVWDYWRSTVIFLVISTQRRRRLLRD